MCVPLKGRYFLNEITDFTFVVFYFILVLQFIDIFILHPGFIQSPSDFDGEDVTPSISLLFFVNETHQKLDRKTADLCHRIVARFLYVAKRARPDLQITEAFLCKQVNCPNTGYWKKLGRLVHYVKATIHLQLIIGSNCSGNIMVQSIDALFAVYMDMKSHTGYYLTLGTGSLISGSSGQRVRSRNSTES